MSHPVPAAILGATGYVGGELLRLLAAHPVFELRAAVSSSRAGTAVAETFPSLAAAYAGMTFSSMNELYASLADIDELALFSAAPHGASATIVADVIEHAGAAGVRVHCVDSSADFRYPSVDDYSAIYGQEHTAPALLPMFQQGLPELVPDSDKPHVGHPGCFATAAMLAAVPLCSAIPEIDALYLNGITGSTGSGSTPLPGTHHPERHGNLYAYKPLGHRHAPEIAASIATTSGREVKVNFVPHSGPFARGIHVTLQASTAEPVSTSTLENVFREFYRDQEFVAVTASTPRIKNVVTSNYCHIGVAAEGNNVVVMSAIDNLVKGAAGGAVQWMNRLWSLPQGEGLQQAAPAWT